MRANSMNVHRSAPNAFHELMLKISNCNSHLFKKQIITMLDTLNWQPTFELLYCLNNYKKEKKTVCTITCIYGLYYYSSSSHTIKHCISHNPLYFSTYSVWFSVNVLLQCTSWLFRLSTASCSSPSRSSQPKIISMCWTNFEIGSLTKILNWLN